MQKNQNLEVIRGIAILFVIVTHTFFIPELGFLREHFDFSRGVDIFFVLSGFLMGATYLSHVNLSSFDVQQAYNFYVKRIARLLPAVIFWNIVILVFSSFWVAIGTFPSRLEVLKSVFANLFFYGKFL